LLIGAVLLLLLKNRKPTTKAVALLLFYTLPVIAFQNFVEQKAEIIFAFYVLAAYFFLLRYAKERSRQLLILCSACSGIAAGLKYFFFPWYAVPIILFLAWLAYRERSRPGALFLWGAIAVVLFSPWMIRNAVISGNPVDPISLPFAAARPETFFSKLGPGSADYVVTEMRNEAYLLWDDHEKKNLKYFLRAPFALTFRGNKKYISDGLLLGPLLLMFLPLVLMALMRQRKKGALPSAELSFAALSLPVLAAGWIFFGHLAIWYAIPVYALFALLAAWAVPAGAGDTPPELGRPGNGRATVLGMHQG